MENQDNKTNKFSEIEDKYNQAFAKVIFKLAEAKELIPLTYVLEHKYQISNFQKIENDIRKLIEEKIYHYCEYYAVAQYLYMEKTDNWTEAGRDRVISSMCYCFFSLGMDEELGFDKYSMLEDTVQELSKTYQLNGLDEVALQKIISEPKIRILGKEIMYTETAKLNRILEVIGSSSRIIMGNSGEYVSMIFGFATPKRFDKYYIYFMEKEYMRTPNAVQYIVAVIDQDQIAVRREVCEYIFNKKWIPVWEEDDFYRLFPERDPETAIAESLKKITINSFQAKTLEEFRQVKQEFLDSMAESLAYHEIAHDALESFNFTLEEVAVSEASVIAGENILSVMNEVLTEWMPGDLAIKGPIKNMLDTALNLGDTKKAKQMFYIYLSDGWFLDTDTEFMFPYTYIMFAVFIKYLEKYDQVEFINMYKDFNDIYNFLCKWHRNIIGELLLLLKRFSYYKQTSKDKDFKAFYNTVSGLMQIVNGLGEKEYNDKQLTTQAWINVFAQIKSLYPELLKQVVALFETQQRLLYKDIILNFGGKDYAEKYGDNIRSYVLDLMSEKGFLSYDQITLQNGSFSD